MIHKQSKKSSISESGHHFEGSLSGRDYDGSNSGRGRPWSWSGPGRGRSRSCSGATGFNSISWPKRRL